MSFGISSLIKMWLSSFECQSCYLCLLKGLVPFLGISHSLNPLISCGHALDSGAGFGMSLELFGGLRRCLATRATVLDGTRSFQSPVFFVCALRWSRNTNKA